MRHIALAGIAFIAHAMSGCGGGDDSLSSKGGGCSKDTDCREPRICVDKQCVDPGSGDSGSPDGAVSSNTGGASGSGGDGNGGSAGTNTDGGSSTGGTSAAGGDGASGGNTATDAAGNQDGSTGGAPQGTACGDKNCAVGETCCYTPATGGILGQPATYACQTGACSLGQFASACNGPAACTSGQVCCQTTAGFVSTGYSCQDQCFSTEIGCGGSKDCPNGQVCCETLTQGGTSATKTACADACAQGEYQLCTSDADCPSGDGAPPTTCQASTLLPTFSVCR